MTAALDLGFTQPERKVSSKRTKQEWDAYVSEQMERLRAEDEQRLETEKADQDELVRATAHEFGVSIEDAEVILAREEDTGIPADDVLDEPPPVFPADQDPRIAEIEAEIDDLLTQADLTQEAEDSQ